MSQKNLSIILPVYNEAENIAILVPNIKKEFETSNSSIEILIVDDNSTDNTNDVVQELDKFQNEKFSITYILRTKQNSLPMSIFEGIEKSKYKYVAWMDADGSMPPRILFQMSEIYFNKNFDVVIGSRYVDGGGYKGVKTVGETRLIEAIKNVRSSNDTVSGMLLSLMLNKFLVFLTKSEVKDITSGFLITDKINLSKEEFYGFDYGEYFIKIIHSFKNSKLNIFEHGYLCEMRMYGESKTGKNLFRLILRGLNYIKVAVKYRK